MKNQTQFFAFSVAIYTTLVFAFAPLFGGITTRWLAIGLGYLLYLSTAITVFNACYLSPIASRKPARSGRHRRTPIPGKGNDESPAPIGIRPLQLIVTIAPLLGLLGTAIGLKGAFLNPQANIASQPILSNVATAIGSTILGIACAVIGHCGLSLPAWQAGHTPNPGTQKALAWPHHPRMPSAFLAHSLSALLIVGVTNNISHPPTDSNLPAPLSTATAKKTSPPASPEADTPTDTATSAGANLDLPLSDLLSAYNQTATPPSLARRIWEWIRYADQQPHLETSFGSAGPAKSYTDNGFPNIGGIAEIVRPSSETPLLNRTFPRLVGCLVTKANNAGSMGGIFAELDGSANPPTWEARSAKDLETKFLELGYDPRYAYIPLDFNLDNWSHETHLQYLQDRSRSLAKELFGDQKHRILWVALENSRKLSLLTLVKGDSLLKGQIGDILLINWKALPRSREEVGTAGAQHHIQPHTVRLVSPNLVRTMLKN